MHPSPKPPRRRRAPAIRTLPPEYLQLIELRLERDWSWRYLQDRMERAGCPVSFGTITYMRSRNGQDVSRLRWTGPRERTLYKIRKFLKLQRSHKRPDTDQQPAA